MEPSSKRKKVINVQPININQKYSADTWKETFKETYKSKECVANESGAQVLTEPFKCCVLKNFIEDENFLKHLKDAVLELEFLEKNNDLFKFHQTDDLQTCKNNFISAFRDLLYGDFLSWLQTITGLSLNDTVDMSASRYDPTDVLLCHDDRLEGRCVAFIYYLVPDSWTPKDGGSLDLFNTNSEGEPGEIVRSLVPKLNNFVFFEVTPFSFHQVSEVVSTDKSRLSISGWFHGNTPNRPSKIALPKSHLYSPKFIEEEFLREWVNPSYLIEETQMQIQQKFEKDSEIKLVSFLQKDKYETLANCFENGELSWLSKGPANRRCTLELDTDAKSRPVPDIVTKCLELFKSEAMFLILSNMTGLSLHSLMAARNKEKTEDNNSDTIEKAKCELAVRKWQHGCYTLIRDQADEDDTDALDVTLFCNATDWKQEYGGYTSYIAKGEDEELLTVLPESNTLALVYRDKETLKFVKHVNSLVQEEENKQQGFQDIHLVYYE